MIPQDTTARIPAIQEAMSGVSGPDHPDPAALTIVYDGECPFCTSYIRLVRLRETAGQVELVDARQPHPILDEIRARGLDLDEGMVVRIDGEYLYGPAAMTALSLLSTRAGVFNRAMRAIFRKPDRAAALYPLLVRGRNATLRVLGRKPIGEGRNG